MDTQVIRQLVGIGFNVLWWLILARVLMSYFRPNPYHPLVKIVVDITDPILTPIQRIVPPVGMIDFSPLVALFLLDLLKMFILNLL